MPDSRHVIFDQYHHLSLGDVVSGEIQSLTAQAVWQGYPSVSPEGHRILHTQTNRDLDIVEIPLDGSPPQPLIATARIEHSPSFSLSGEMAFVTNRYGDREVWIQSAGKDWERRVVTQDDFPDDRTITIYGIALSPDGTRVAYVRQGEKTSSDLWISPAEGGQPVRAFPGSEKVYSAPAWSPDSQFLTATATVEGTSRLVIGRPGTREPFRVLHDDFYPRTVSAWSPDGKWIACGGIDSTRILIISPGGKESRILPSPTSVDTVECLIAWSIDSRTLYVASSLRGGAQLYAVDVQTGDAREIADWGESFRFDPNDNRLIGSLTADGKGLVTTINTEKSDLWILEGFPQPQPSWWR
jgi:Tol biopolymer transport system component